MGNVDANRILYVKQNFVMGDGKFHRMRGVGDSPIQEVALFVYQRQTIM